MRTHSDGNANQNQEPVTIKTNTPAPKEKRKNETPIPKDFSISDDVRAWAASRGHTRLDAHLEHFRLQCEAKGYTYKNHDAAFKRAIKDDWAKLGPAAKAPKLTVLPELPRRDGEIPDAAKALIAKMRAHG